jgi:glutamate-1-semialdehyde aminotransferase
MRSCCSGGRSWSGAALAAIWLRYLGPAVGRGIIECATRRPLWLPYAEVERIGEATEHARQLGAAVLLEPREGPSGWRSVVSSPVAGEVALWEPKR